MKEESTPQQDGDIGADDDPSLASVGPSQTKEGGISGSAASAPVDVNENVDAAPNTSKASRYCIHSNRSTRSAN